MIRQSTIDKLHDMHLSAMSDAFESQCADNQRFWGKTGYSQKYFFLHNAQFKNPFWHF